jgi:hypothetical protein
VGAPDVAVLVHQTPGHDEHLSPATQEMLHIGGFSSKHALGMVDPWLFGSGARPLVAAAPWRVCRDVDLAVLGKWVGAAGVHFQVKLVDSWRHYRGDARDLLELNRIVLDRLDTGLAGRPTTATASKGGSGSATTGLTPHRRSA